MEEQAGTLWLHNARTVSGVKELIHSSMGSQCFVSSMAAYALQSRNYRYRVLSLELTGDEELKTTYKGKRTYSAQL